VFEVTPFERALDEPLARPRFNATLLAAFAAATLLLVGAGLYATMSALVQQRAREIGVRMALGAQRGQVGRSIVTRGTWIAVVGTVVGLSLSIVAAGIARRLLYGVRPVDPMTLIATAGLAIAVTVLASLIPALRASRIDAMTTLRSE
jgi:putative ABC transport system permease protein